MTYGTAFSDDRYRPDTRGLVAGGRFTRCRAWLAAPTLDYVLRTWAGELQVWVGEDPRTFGEQDPPLFDSLPRPVRAFLWDVHAGFTTWDSESCGLIAPRSMKTLAARWDDHEFPGTQRLLFVTEGAADAGLCTSPDLPPGTAVTYFEPDFEVEPFGEALDKFMNMPLGG